MEEASEPTGQAEPPPFSVEPAAPIESRFLFVDVAALRAKQLRRGARVRFHPDTTTPWHKPERVAMEEVRRGLVPYGLPSAKSEGERAEP